MSSVILMILQVLIYFLEQLTEQNFLYPKPLINYKGLPQFKHFGFSSKPFQILYIVSIILYESLYLLFKYDNTFESLDIIYL